MFYDLRLAFAALRRESMLSLLVVLILAASLGVHTAVFSLVHAAFFRPLPYQDAERLVVVETVSIFGLDARDPSSFTFALLALLAAGAIACMIPAWRAMHVHPTESMHEVR